MVLSNKPLSSASAAQEYYSHGDYYGNEGTGIWFGKGTKALGLQGTFNAKDNNEFSNLLKGILPNDQVLGRKTKDGIEHRPGIDLTFSCPKSFSIQMLLYARKEEKANMEKAMMNAIEKTLEYISEHGYVITRRGHNGIKKEKADKLVFALFNHTTNRNLEPQAHTHCFLANVAKCSDGKYRSINYDKILINNNLIGQVFRNELALEVKRLGYEINTNILRDGSSSFELTNIHPKLIKAFSTRRQEILDLCEKYGVTTKEGRNKIVINSRKAKETVEQEKLVGTWKVIEENVAKELLAASNKTTISNSGQIISHNKLGSLANNIKELSEITLKDSFVESSYSQPNSKNEDLNEINQSLINEVVNKFGNDNAIYTQNKPDIADIFDAFYNRLPSMLPEFGFINRGSYYVSTTGQKVDGTVGKKGKVYVYANNPGVLIDYTRGSKSLWDYVKNHHSTGNSNKETFEYLSNLVGYSNVSKVKPLISPKTQSMVVETEAVIENTTWTKVHTFAQKMVDTPNNQVSKYLELERGYTTKMGIGYIPSKKTVLNYLKATGVPEKQIREVSNALGYIGSTHKMVIPYHDKKGQIIGFAARDVQHDTKSQLGKYMYTKGLSKNDTLFNIHEINPTVMKELIIVEGLLDCLHAKAHGIKNVVALGGTSFSQKQAELINELGITEITICLDNDKAGKEASSRVTDLIYENLPNVQVKLVKLPEGIKDLDELLKKKGFIMAQNIIEKAELIQNITVIQENTGVTGYKVTTENSGQINSFNGKEDYKQPNDSSVKNDFISDKSSIGDNAASIYTARDLAMLCIQDVTNFKTVFTEEDLLKKTLKFSIGLYSTKEICKEIKEVEKTGFIIRSGEHLTSKELLIKESQILKFAENGLQKAKPILKASHFESKCRVFERREQAKNPEFVINEQQKRALKHLLTSKDNITAIEGLPGVGKSTILNGVREISNRKIISLIGFGEKFHGTAPTASAAKTLKESAGIDSLTLHSFLAKYQGYIEDRGTQMSLQALRRELKKTILFLDESSLVSTRLMWRLLKLQDKFGFRLVLIGDTKQLGAVEAGNPFEQMLKVIFCIRLDKVVRQIDLYHREAVVSSSKGEINKTFDIYKDNIREEGNIKLLVRQVANLYMEKNFYERDKTLLLSPTRKLRDGINKNIRAELKKEGSLHGTVEKFAALRQKDMSIADYRFAGCFTKGDILRFNVSYKNGINKGDYLKVIKTNQITNSLVLEKYGKQFIYHLKKGVQHETKFEVFNEMTLKFQKGLKIKFTKNNKELGLINSETAIIHKIGKESIILKMENGNINEVPKSQLRHIDYGYCVTVHAGQGKTFNNTIAAISTNKLLNNQKTWLVILSRHKNEFTALVEDKDKLQSYLMKNKGIETSAIELVSQLKLHQNIGSKLLFDTNKANVKKEIQAQA